MSKQLTDTIDRILENALVQVNQGKTKKAFENLESSDTFMQKGEKRKLQNSSI